MMKITNYITIPTPLILLLVVLAMLTGCAGRQAETETSEDRAADIQKRAFNEHIEAVCYSGFREGQHPDRGEGAINPSVEEIEEDLRIISEDAGFHLIRLYDCGKNSKMTLETIRQKQLDIEVMLGIWLRAEVSNHEGCDWLTEPIPEEELIANAAMNAEQVKRGIALANEYPEIITAINVGNEALVEWNDHMVPGGKVIEYVRRVKENVEQLVTVADNYAWWAEHGDRLAEEVDFLAIHVYPVWEGKDIDEAMAYTRDNVNAVKSAHPDKEIVITEAGWPDTASEFGARASAENQKLYLDSLLIWSHDQQITIFIFEAFDEPWKGDPANPEGAEKHWGLYYVDRSPKLFMHERIRDIANNKH